VILTGATVFRALPFSFLLFLACGHFAAATAPPMTPPGVIIDHMPSDRGTYVGSPTIVMLPDGAYLAAHDEFGPKMNKQAAVSRVFRSDDKGKTWKQVGKIEGRGAFWSSLFFHRGSLYLLGSTKEYGDLVIRKSTDAGVTWTEPIDEKTGLISANGRYHCAPTPVIVHNGRIWRGFEDAQGPGGWGSHFRAFMLSAPEDADLLNAASWTFSNRIGRDPTWLDNHFGGFLEGNAVVAPDGKLVDILRVERNPEGQTAAMIHISDDGKAATFDPAKDFFTMPGGPVKFTIRFDPQTKKYWSLMNHVLPQHKNAVAKPASIRNCIALACSDNLRDWEIRSILLYHPDTKTHGFQYIDWLFDGNDLIAACRTAHDEPAAADGKSPAQAHNFHDANYLTFHRVENFREKSMKDSVKIPE
jgi:hypothetical protein